MLDGVRRTVREAKVTGSPVIVKAVMSGSRAEGGPAMSWTSPGVTTRSISTS
jgi:hypothetical protein